MHDKASQTPVSDAGLKQEPQSGYPIFPGAALANGTTQNDVSNRVFYPDPSLQTYPQLGFGDQTQANVATQGFQPEPAALFYQSSGQGTMAGTVATALPDASAQGNPMITFPQHVGPLPQQDFFGRNYNTWHNWSAAINDPSQDRFHAPPATLVNMGAAPRDSTVQGALADVTSAEDLNGAPVSVWPPNIYRPQ